MQMENHVRTTLDLPDDLVRAAMRASNQRTKTAVIITALEHVVRKSKIQQLKSYRGRLNIDLDLDALRKRK